MEYNHNMISDANDVNLVRSRFRVRRGFTLIELLVVVGIIAVLVGILVPAVRFAKESANTAKCLSNLKQIGTAITQYALDHDDCLVPGDTFGMRDGSSNPGPGSWADILVFGNYLTAPWGLYPAPDVTVAQDPASRDNVLRCPNGVEVDAANPGCYPTSQTDGAGKFFSIRGSDIAGRAVKVWYAVNAAKRASIDDLNKPQTPFVVLPTGFLDSTGKPTLTPQWGMHRFNQFKDASHLPLVFDGVWMTDPFNQFGMTGTPIDPFINARHGNIQYTNILFADHHCETKATSALWPDVDWYLK
jgi:prepilin-type N-terminal cleavage/methylation domain-containing protein